MWWLRSPLARVCVCVRARVCDWLTTLLRCCRLLSTGGVDMNTFMSIFYWIFFMVVLGFSIKFAISYYLQRQRREEEELGRVNPVQGVQRISISTPSGTVVDATQALPRAEVSTTSGSAPARSCPTCGAAAANSSDSFCPTCGTVF